MASSRSLALNLRPSARPLARGLRSVPSACRTKATVPFRLPDPRNEPNVCARSHPHTCPADLSQPTYTKGSPERARLEAALTKLRSQLPVQSDIYYNGKAQKASKSLDQPLPAEHGTKFTNYPLATKEQVSTAIESALKAKQSWEQTPFVDRAAIFLRAADLVTTKYRYELIAATMLGQGKNIWQGEIDAAAELADFFRLNCNFAAELLERQPTRGSDGMWR